VGPHLVSLSHRPDGRLAFLLHNADPAATPSSSSVPAARAALCDYLNAAVPLADLWRQFTAADARFAEVAARLGGGGARVLRQDPVQCLFQFLCSSNNNIARIHKMVWTLAGYGERLGEVGGFVFHRFPTIERLAQVSEQELRDAGFGYRSVVPALYLVVIAVYATPCTLALLLYVSKCFVLINDQGKVHCWHC
jgi:N-glycosylase/DNA lyase